MRARLPLLAGFALEALTLRQPTFIFGTALCAFSLSETFMGIPLL